MIKSYNVIHNKTKYAKVRYCAQGFDLHRGYPTIALQKRKGVKETGEYSRKTLEQKLSRIGAIIAEASDSTEQALELLVRLTGLQIRAQQMLEEAYVMMMEKEQAAGKTNTHRFIS